MDAVATTSPQFLHFFTLVPVLLQVAALVSVQVAAASCPPAATLSVFVPLQLEQVKVLTPLTVQVAGVVITPLSQLWPSAGIVSVTVSPQEHVLVTRPSDAQVASIVVVVQLC